MLLEVSFGAILGYVGKELVNLFKNLLAERSIKKRFYFEKKIEITIETIAHLNSILTRLHNVALSLKHLERLVKNSSTDRFPLALQAFSKAHSDLYDRAKEFPHKLGLFYHIPTFETLFVQMNELYESALFTSPIPDIPKETTKEDLENILKKISDRLNEFFQFIPKIEEKERLLAGCIKNIQDQFKRNQ